MKVSKTTLNCALMLLLIYHIVVVRFPYLAQANNIRYTLILILGILVFPYYRNLIHIKEKSIKYWGLIYICLVLYSAFINRNTHVITHTLVGALVYTVAILEMMISFRYILEHKGIEFLLKAIFIVTFIYVIINDLLLAYNPTMFYTSKGSYYLVGNKFAVAYRHMELLGLYLALSQTQSRNKHYKKVVMIVGLILISLWASQTVQGGKSGNSVTGILAIALMTIYYCLPSTLWSKTFVFVAFLLGSIGFAFGVETILAVPSIQNFIVNVLHRDLSLTGRVNIYGFIPKILSNRLLWGYGYGSSYETWMNATHIFPNSQNGLVDCIVEQGLIATVILILIVTLVMSKTSVLLKDYPYMKSILLIVYVYATIASVEVTISIVFIMWCILIFSASSIVEEIGRGELNV